MNGSNIGNGELVINVGTPIQSPTLRAIPAGCNQETHIKGGIRFIILPLRSLLSYNYLSKIKKFH